MGSKNPAQKEKKAKFWNFIPAVPQENKPAELILYGEIASESWWGDEVTPRQFGEELAALGDVAEIVVRINSPGGDVFAANAIYTRLKDNAATITVKIDGWAASAATIIAAAGDKVLIARNGVMMYHDPAMNLRGYFKADELEKQIAALVVIKNSVVNALAMKTGKTEEEVSEIMKAETWYTGAEAVENGFADELMFEEKDVETEVQDDCRVVVNSVAFDLSPFRSIPKALLNSRPARNGGGFTDTHQHQQEKEKKTDMEIKNVEQLEQAYPDLVKQIRDHATAAERARIKAIEDLALNGFETIVNTAKFEKPESAADVAMKIVVAQKKQGEAFLDSRDKDVKDSKVGEVGAEASEGAGSGKENPFEAAIDSVFPAVK